MDKGKFISVEGIDGAGKGTQLDFLCAFLREQGIDFQLLREPGGTAIGEQIRKILLGAENGEMQAETELFLFAAARAQLVHQVIEPALAGGQWVVCDRFFDSTWAYQAGGRRLDRKLVRQTIEMAVGGLEPDLTFYLDLDPELALNRRKQREMTLGEAADRMESESLAFSQRVRAEYLNLVQASPRIRKIDADRSPDLVWQQMQVLLEAEFLR